MNIEILNILVGLLIFFSGMAIGRLLNFCICFMSKNKKTGSVLFNYKYPVIEMCDGLLCILIFAISGFRIESVIFSLFVSALVALAVIDWKTYEIPISINIFIVILGSLRVILDIRNLPDYIAGFFSVSMLLLVIYLVSKGSAIGGGDIKLMASAGLLLGFQLIITAFFIGCILGAVIQVIRMKIMEEGSVFAMGPYLSAGLIMSVLWGKDIISWYLTIL